MARGSLARLTTPSGGAGCPEVLKGMGVMRAMRLMAAMAVVVMGVMAAGGEVRGQATMPAVRLLTGAEMAAFVKPFVDRQTVCWPTRTWRYGPGGASGVRSGSARPSKFPAEELRELLEQRG